MREPVYPQVGNGYGRDHHPGMSLRTLFMALSMLGQRASGKLELDPITSDEIAELAESDADALLKKIT